jgi:hypothetical protein
MSGPNDSNSGHGGGNSGPGGGGGNPGHGGGDPGGGGNPGPGGNVHIVVDGETKSVRAGDWLVSELKKKVDVDASKVLAEITPTGLVDLDDLAHITVKDGMRFMSHVRKGGSS